MKILHIEKAHSLRVAEHLPTVMEQLSIINNQNLERVSHLPGLQFLFVDSCPALKYVQRPHSLRELGLVDTLAAGIPDWLAMLLEERKATDDDDDDDDFFFTFTCSGMALRRLLKGGRDWPIIERIPQVLAYDDVVGGFLRYTQKPYMM